MKTFYLSYKGSKTAHKVKAASIEEAKAKLLKGTKYIYSEIIIVPKSKIYNL
jgi:hypothetical protein